MRQQANAVRAGWAARMAEHEADHKRRGGHRRNRPRNRRIEARLVGADDRAGQEAHGPLAFADGLQSGGHLLIHGHPFAGLAVSPRMLQTQLVVQPQEGSLPGGAQSAARQRMVRIAFELDGPAVAVAAPAGRSRRCSRRTSRRSSTTGPEPGWPARFDVGMPCSEPGARWQPARPAPATANPAIVRKSRRLNGARRRRQGPAGRGGRRPRRRARGFAPSDALASALEDASSFLAVNDDRPRSPGTA